MKSTRHQPRLAVLFASLAIAGCSISSELFTEGAVDEDAGGGGTTTTSSDGGGFVTSSSSSGGGPSSSSAGGSTSTTSSGGGGDMLPPVDCGDTSCSTAMDGACCFDRYGIFGAPQAECVSGPIPSDNCNTSHPSEQGEPSVETRIECQTSAQCGASEVCCGTLKQGFSQGQAFNYYEGVTCETSCQYPNIQLCDTLQDSSSCPELPIGGGGTTQGVCQASTLLPDGYIVCGFP